jgi:hypothetical protein
VALGAAVQAGLYSGAISGLMVMDIWQASLMRALAMQKLRADSETAKEVLGEDFDEYSAAEVPANAESAAEGDSSL